jgi:transposase
MGGKTEIERKSSKIIEKCTKMHKNAQKKALKGTNKHQKAHKKH